MPLRELPLPNRSDLPSHPAQRAPFPQGVVPCKWTGLLLPRSLADQHVCHPPRALDLPMPSLAHQLTHIYLRTSYEERNNTTLSVTLQLWDVSQFQKIKMWKKMSHRNQKLTNSFLFLTALESLPCCKRDQGLFSVAFFFSLFPIIIWTFVRNTQPLISYVCVGVEFACQ